MRDSVISREQYIGKPGQKTEACSGKCMRNPGRQASYSADWWWIATATKWVQYSEYYYAWDNIKWML